MIIEKELTKLRELTERLKDIPFTFPAPKIKELKNLIGRLKDLKCLK